MIQQNWQLLLFFSSCLGIWHCQLTTQIWVVTRHQYGISALISQTSFGRETSGSVTKCWLFHRMSVDYWSTAYRQLADRILWELFNTFTLKNIYTTSVEGLLLEIPHPNGKTKARQAIFSLTKHFAEYQFIFHTFFKRCGLNQNFSPFKIHS